jgi:hypothetical protein
VLIEIQKAKAPSNSEKPNKKTNYKQELSSLPFRGWGYEKQDTIGSRQRVVAVAGF